MGLRGCKNSEKLKIPQSRVDWDFAATSLWSLQHTVISFIWISGEQRGREDEKIGRTRPVQCLGQIDVDGAPKTSLV